MPTYDYICPVCDFESEIVHSITSEQKYACPICKDVDLKRLISNPNFVLKGQGWYKDGYSTKKAK
jgi:putative FmdB family regulatory protein